MEDNRLQFQMHTSAHHIIIIIISIQVYKVFLIIVLWLRSDWSVCQGRRMRLLVGIFFFFQHRLLRTQNIDATDNAWNGSEKKLQFFSFGRYTVFAVVVYDAYINTPRTLYVVSARFQL